MESCKVSVGADTVLLITIRKVEPLRLGSMYSPQVREGEGGSCAEPKQAADH